MSNPRISMKKVNANRSMDFINEVEKTEGCKALEVADFGAKKLPWVKILLPNGQVICVRPKAFHGTHVSKLHPDSEELEILLDVKFTFERKKNSDGEVFPPSEVQLASNVTVDEFTKLDTDTQERYEYDPANKNYKLIE